MSPVHFIGEQLRSVFLMIPMWFVKGLFIAVPLTLMIWVVRLPTARAVPPGTTHRWDEDLRIWAWLALALQVLVYCIF